MTTYDAAIALMLRSVERLDAEAVPIAHAAGRVLAEAVVARAAAPRRDVAVMDGYALADASLRAGAPLRLIGEARAGARFRGAVGPGEAVRIFTGAPMPEGAERCIPQEAADRDGDFVGFPGGAGPLRYIRPAGSDFAAGAQLLAAGTRLSPRALVTAAAADQARMLVVRRPRIAVLATGDELAPPGEAHARGDAVPDSITAGLAAMAAGAGGELVRQAICPDDAARLHVEAGAALAGADVVLVTGGASVGERDLARPTFAGHGLEMLFARLAIKPGRPVWLGRAGGRWVLGLPGNPTSAMVVARLFMQPLLALLQGEGLADVLAWRMLPLAAPLPATGERETMVRARWDADGLVPLENQDSGAQSPLVKAEWLIRSAPRAPVMPAGTLVRAISF